MGISSNTEIDFKQFPLDEPLPPDLTTNGERGSLEHFMRGDGTPGIKTLRELGVEASGFGVKVIGTAPQVADQLEAIAAEVGGDGFLISLRGLTRRYITDICDSLVPELQRRGLTRTEYTKPTLRETLREF